MITFELHFNLLEKLEFHFHFSAYFPKLYFMRIYFISVRLGVCVRPFCRYMISSNHYLPFSGHKAFTRFPWHPRRRHCSEMFIVSNIRHQAFRFPLIFDPRGLEGSFMFWFDSIRLILLSLLQSVAWKMPWKFVPRIVNIISQHYSWQSSLYIIVLRALFMPLGRD